MSCSVAPSVTVADGAATYRDAAGRSRDPTLWELVGEVDMKLDKPADAELAFRESLRVKDRRTNAGRLTREICEDLGGSAGGHGSMAGARIPLWGKSAQRQALKRSMVKRFRQAFGVERGRGISLLTTDE